MITLAGSVVERNGMCNAICIELIISTRWSIAWVPLIRMLNANISQNRMFRIMSRSSAAFEKFWVYSLSDICFGM